MVIQYKTVLKITFFVIFLINPVLKSQQLALPKNLISPFLINKLSSLKDYTDNNSFQNSMTCLSYSIELPTRTANSECWRYSLKMCLETTEILRLLDSKKMFLCEKILGNIWGNLSYSFSNFNEIRKSRISKNRFVDNGNKLYAADNLGKLNEVTLSARTVFTSLGNLKAVVEGIVFHDILYDTAVENYYCTFKAVQTHIPKYHLAHFSEYKRNKMCGAAFIENNLVKAISDIS